MGKTVEDVVALLRSVTERAAKACGVCGKHSPRTASTCPDCGEASWGPLTDMVVRRQKDTLHARVASAQSAALQCLRLFSEAAGSLEGITAHVDDSVQSAVIAGRDATLFASLFLTDPRLVNGGAPGVTISFAHCLNSTATDGFIIGAVHVSPMRLADAWPLRCVRLGAVSTDVVVEIIDALLAEAFFEEA